MMLVFPQLSLCDPVRCGTARTQPEGVCVNLPQRVRTSFPLNSPQSGFIRRITVNDRVTGGNGSEVKWGRASFTRTALSEET